MLQIRQQTHPLVAITLYYNLCFVTTDLQPCSRYNANPNPLTQPALQLGLTVPSCWLMANECYPSQANQ